MSIVASGIVSRPCAVSTTTSSPSVPAQHALDALRAVASASRSVSCASSPAKRAKSASLLQRPVEPRRRHLQPLEVDVLDGEQPRQVVATPARSPRRRRRFGLSMNTRTSRLLADISQSTSSYPIAGTVRSSSSPSAHRVTSTCQKPDPDVQKKMGCAQPISHYLSGRIVAGNRVDFDRPATAAGSTASTLNWHARCFIDGKPPDGRPAARSPCTATSNSTCCPRSPTATA